jgi:AGCS family alanine or glycine:cation symporter
MREFVNTWLEMANGILWHDYVLYTVLGTGVLFLVWSKFSPWMSLTHGVQVIRGKFDHKNDPGAISHFQALSAALSATVGLGNIGGVAMAVSLGGPGAVFWMWVVGFVGMALKLTEVIQAMLYRRIDSNGEPHGGAMFVASDGLKSINPKLAGIGHALGVLFCVTLLVSTVTGGNMFQAWNVAIVTEKNFAVPQLYSGIIMAVLCALVIIGGIKRIGNVAGALVPIMCGLYLIAAVAVLIAKIEELPGYFRLIITSAFSPSEAQGAFLGGTFGYAFYVGMKRALFSNEAGQGSAPIAHSAAKTDEPVREGIVSGLEPFIDTLVVCTLTALVVLSSGAWNRPPLTNLSEPAKFTATDAGWQLPNTTIAKPAEWQRPEKVFMVIETTVNNKDTGNNLQKVSGTVSSLEGSDQLQITWEPINSEAAPVLRDQGIYGDYVGAALTSYAFDSVFEGLGKWMVTIACWLFAISTMISWSYYGEQGVVYIFGKYWVSSYRIIYCILIIVATAGFITTDRELDNLTGLGTGVMLMVNIPIMLIFGKIAMDAYATYVDKLRQGKFS